MASFSRAENCIEYAVDLDSTARVFRFASQRRSLQKTSSKEELSWIALCNVR